MFRLDGLTALITGSATGIGAGIAVSLAKQGAQVVISDKPEISLEKTEQRICEVGLSPMKIELDIRESSQRIFAYEKIRNELGGVDILVNNAGINRPVDGLNASEGEWDDHFNTNVKGGFFLSKLIAPQMIEKGWGRIIWTSSQSGLVAIPGQPLYCGSKGAIIQIVRTLAVEWAKFGITVNSVAPTFVETNLTRKRLQDPDFKRFVLEKIPSKKLAEVDDIAAGVVYLASHEAKMVNGHTLAIDGGWTVW